jgi:hypothetical protein
MFTILPDQQQLSDIIKKFDDLSERISDMPEQMNQELSNWERDDMNRRESDVGFAGPLSVLTHIFARGREQIEARRLGRRRAVIQVSGHFKQRRRGRTADYGIGSFWWRQHRRRGAQPGRGQRYIIASRRPIVRPELMDQLQTRMRDLMERAFVWRRR